MINFERYIRQALFEFDFFIVPDFGSFIAAFSVLQEHDEFKPSKSFEFNGLLRNDIEHKFINFVYQHEKYPEATIRAELTAYINQIKQQLGTNSRCMVANVLSVTLDEKGLFEGKIDKDINFYDESQLDRGRSPSEKIIFENEAPTVTTKEELQEVPQNREEPVAFVSKPIETPVSSRPDEWANQPTEAGAPMYQPPPSGLKLRPFVIVGLGLAFLAVMAYFYRRSSQPKTNVLPKNTVQQPITTAMESDSTYALSEELAASKSQSTETHENAMPMYPFEVAAGIFKNETNAHNLMAKMQEAGFKAEIRLVNGMRRVYVGVNTLEEAEAMSKRIEGFTGLRSVYFNEDGNTKQ